MATPARVLRMPHDVELNLHKEWRALLLPELFIIGSATYASVKSPRWGKADTSLHWIGGIYLRFAIRFLFFLIVR
jgi:hypothetical protein